MFRIALCDGEGPQRELIRRMLADCIAQWDFPAQICEFVSGQELLDALQEQHFDLYLLDILSQELDGIWLGTTLRDMDKAGIVIYLAISPDFTLASDDSRTYSYLLKPIGSENLSTVLDERRREKSVIIKTAEGAARLSLNSILYVELTSRAPHYYLRDGSCVAGMTIRVPFQDAVRPLLEDKRFHLCGSSFALNLYHIRSISKSEILFDGGRRTVVPRRALPALQSAWMDYWMEEWAE